MRNQVASSGMESPDESRREQRELSGSTRKAVGWGRTEVLVTPLTCCVSL